MSAGICGIRGIVCCEFCASGSWPVKGVHLTNGQARVLVALARLSHIASQVSQIQNHRSIGAATLPSESGANSMPFEDGVSSALDYPQLLQDFLHLLNVY